jgi:hypothetical protein
MSGDYAGNSSYSVELAANLSGLVTDIMTSTGTSSGTSSGTIMAEPSSISAPGEFSQLYKNTSRANCTPPVSRHEDGTS